MHLAFFALSLVNEANAIRKQYKNNDGKLIYLSSALSQLEQLAELTFAHLNETVEPLIYFFESLKALLRLKEYIGLITKEKIGCYISKENYEVHKKEEERKKSMVTLPRSKKMLPKPDNFTLSNKMVKYALKSVNSIDSLASLDDAQALGDPARFSKSGNSDKKEQNHGMFTRLFLYIKSRLHFAKKIVNSRKFKLVEIIMILRPVIYMCMLLKYGKTSFAPFLVSLAIEVFGIFLSIQKSES
jgi:hypothetical protein